MSTTLCITRPEDVWQSCLVLSCRQLCRRPETPLAISENEREIRVEHARSVHMMRRLSHRSCPFREGLHCKCLGRPGSSCPGMPLAPRGSPCLDNWYVLLSVVMLTCDPRCLSLAVALPNIDSECRLAKPQNLPKRANCARWSCTSCPEAGCGASVCPARHAHCG